MNKLGAERGILDDTIRAIRREAGLQLDIVGREANIDGKRIDAVIQMPNNGTRLVAVIKKWITHANLGAVINQINNLAELGQGLLIADYINQNMGKRLKEAGIQFLDVAGNAYIDQWPVYIHVKGNNPERAVLNAKTGKAFQATGMKLIFAILGDEDLVNAPYREIAGQAGVALGTVGGILDDLATQGFLLKGTKANHRKLNDRGILVDKWAEAYPYRLKKKHRLGLFTTDNPDWWKIIDPETFEALWGGEIAAAKFANYLNPKHGVVYIRKTNLENFLQVARLRKVDPYRRQDRYIDFVEPFWEEAKNKSNAEQTGVAPHIITYADLIETGDVRNLDTANKLREKHLR